MTGCCSVDTYMEFNVKIGSYVDKVSIDKEKYQRLVGKLIYLSYTRSDISYAVSIASQFMQALYEEHMGVVNNILRYLKTSPEKI